MTALQHQQQQKRCRGGLASARTPSVTAARLPPPPLPGVAVDPVADVTVAPEAAPAPMMTDVDPIYPIDLIWDGKDGGWVGGVPGAAPGPEGPPILVDGGPWWWWYDDTASSPEAAPAPEAAATPEAAPAPGSGDGPPPSGCSTPYYKWLLPRCYKPLPEGPPTPTDDTGSSSSGSGGKGTGGGGGGVWHWFCPRGKRSEWAGSLRARVGGARALSESHPPRPPRCGSNAQCAFFPCTVAELQPRAMARAQTR